MVEEEVLCQTTGRALRCATPKEGGKTRASFHWRHGTALTQTSLSWPSGYALGQRTMCSKGIEVPLIEIAKCNLQNIEKCSTGCGSYLLKQREVRVKTVVRIL